ncbi:hypothetical protein J437_LFUL000580 [Ladona fulva]|uniref:CCHC-type domain-containing protein n=1 Tax=Ladona fulva TaxID=123851 RepID=A0A8K0KAR3_LADFU|nr:hypothetical protein J437_LFUL000580 [Ladona fulva]
MLPESDVIYRLAWGLLRPEVAAAVMAGRPMSVRAFLEQLEAVDQGLGGFPAPVSGSSSVPGAAYPVQRFPVSDTAAISGTSPGDPPVDRLAGILDGISRRLDSLEKKQKGNSWFRPAPMQSGRGTKCFHCGRTGHLARDCPDRARSIQCYACGERGHYASGCEARPRPGNGAAGPAPRGRME